jgi:hypothetical protein
MENITTEQTKFTPSILLDYEQGLIEIKGDSLPENTAEFYKPLMDGLKKYFEAPQETTTVNLELTYFNSSSSKLFFDFFDLLENASENHTIIINWCYDEENESMEEAGEDFAEDFEDLNFNMVTL